MATPNRTCSVLECSGKVIARQMCRKHYSKWHKANGPRCKVEECEYPRSSTDYCITHAKRFAEFGDPLQNPVPPKRETCSIEGCSNTHYGRGWCENHYARWRRHGSTDDIRAGKSDPEERYWPNVSKTNECWLWTGPKNSSGYGSFNDGDRVVGPHVYALTRLGFNVEGLEVDHQCHNKSDCFAGSDCKHRLCVNPDHLEVVDHDENARRRSIRQTHCKHGHEFTVENTRMTRLGRTCKRCHRNRMITSYRTKGDPRKRNLVT